MLSGINPAELLDRNVAVRTRGIQASMWGQLMADLEIQPRINMEPIETSPTFPRRDIDVAYLASTQSVGRMGPWNRVAADIHREDTRENGPLLPPPSKRNETERTKK